MTGNAATGVGSARSIRDHDLRNLLYLVTGFTQLVRDGVSGTVTVQQKQFLDHVLDCARRAQDLLKASVRDSNPLFADSASDSRV